MSKAYILGMIVGIVFALIFALISYFTNKMRYKCKFDERQILARGKAFQAGFFTMIGYYMIYGILDVSEIQWCEDFIGIMLGIFLGMAVFVIMATHNDAYMAMNKSLSRYIVLSIFIIAANLVGALGNFIDGKMVVDGRLTDDNLNLIAAVLWMIVLITQIVHKVRLNAIDKAKEE